MKVYMSVSRSGVIAAVIAAMLTWQTPVWGIDFKYPLLNDPLRTKPEVLKKGVILPGDTKPIPRWTSKKISRPLTLGEAVDIALSNNPQVKSYWANIKVQAAALGEARAAYLPTVRGVLGQTKDNIDYLRSSYSYLDTSVDRTTFLAGLSWLIFDFGGRGAHLREANHLLAAALASYNAALQDALAKVTQAYFNAMIAKADVKAATENEEIAQATLNSAKDREERGVVSRSDRLRATTAHDNTVLDNNRAQGNYQKVLAVLGRIMGVPANTVITMPEYLPVKAAKMGKNLKEWLKIAEKNHPAIIAAKAQVKAAENQVRVATSEGLPSVNFAANFYNNTRPGEAVSQVPLREYTFGVVVNIPIFEGFANTYKIKGARDQVEQKKAQLADTEMQIALDLIRAYADTVSALRNLDVSAHLVQAAQEALAVSRRRYEMGAADITELLDTQAALSVARRERLRCLAEWHSARLRLLASAGRLGRTAVLKVGGQ
jgi:outer membrane protein